MNSREAFLQQCCKSFFAKDCIFAIASEFCILSLFLIDYVPQGYCECASKFLTTKPEFENNVLLFLNLKNLLHFHVIMKTELKIDPWV